MDVERAKGLVFHSGAGVVVFAGANVGGDLPAPHCTPDDVRLVGMDIGAATVLEKRGRGAASWAEMVAAKMAGSGRGDSPRGGNLCDLGIQLGKTGPLPGKGDDDFFNGTA